MCSRGKKKGKSNARSDGFCVRDSEAKKRALQPLHIYCSITNSYSSTTESNKQNPRDRTLDLPFFVCYLHLISIKDLPSAAPSDS